MSEPIRDIHGREVKPGDLIRVYHYTNRRRRKCYMHKLVVLVDDKLNICKTGTHLYGVDVADIWKTGILNAAHKYPMEGNGPFEIIDGLSFLQSGNLECWWERKKVKPNE
jgi:hypothetical protein